MVKLRKAEIIIIRIVVTGVLLSNEPSTKSALPKVAIRSPT